MLLLFGLRTSAADKTHYKTVENIAYKTSTDQYVAELCRLDVYYNDTARTAPVVVWFHGGGLTGGSKYVPDELKEKGLTVVAVNYRLLPRVKIDECLDDCAAAVAWVFKNVAHYGGDTRRIYVSGHSAGGYITTMLGLDKQWLTRYGVDADSIKALVPFSGSRHERHRQSATTRRPFRTSLPCAPQLSSPRAYNGRCRNRAVRTL